MVRGNLRAVCSKDKQVVYALYNMHVQPAGSNFKEGEKIVKPVIIEDYAIQMGYVDVSHKMANSYSISKKAWKWTNNIFSIC